MEKYIFKKNQLKPMLFGESLIWFGFWTALLIVFIYGGHSVVNQIGLSEFEGFVLVMTLPLSLMFVSAVVAYYAENKKNMGGFLNRYRMNKLKMKDIYWGVGLFIFMTFTYGLFSIIGKIILEKVNISIPTNLFSLIDPQFVMNTDNITKLVGSPIQGNYEVLILYFVMLLFNIMGEELLWRGYILPRQELAYGKNTWILHGTMWTFFHLFKWWDLIGLLPVCLSLSYVAQKSKSIWPGIIAHFLFNGMGLVLFVFAVIG